MSKYAVFLRAAAPAFLPQLKREVALILGSSSPHLLYKHGAEAVSTEIHTTRSKNGVEFRASLRDIWMLAHRLRTADEISIQLVRRGTSFTSLSLSLFSPSELFSVCFGPCQQLCLSFFTLMISTSNHLGVYATTMTQLRRIIMGTSLHAFARRIEQVKGLESTLTQPSFKVSPSPCIPPYFPFVDCSLLSPLYILSLTICDTSLGASTTCPW